MFRTSGPLRLLPTPAQLARCGWTVWGNPAVFGPGDRPEGPFEGGRSEAATARKQPAASCSFRPDPYYLKMILQTSRLILRPLQGEDAAGLFAIFGDAQAMAFWDRGPLPRVATVEAMIADEMAGAATGSFLYWTVLKERNIIGSIDLSHIVGSHAWTGFLFRRDVWGQGLAREALAGVIADAFGRLRLSRLGARIQTSNRRAARLLESSGFYKEGVLPDVLRDGERRACVRYGLVRSKSPGQIDDER
jgi:ribosomal-protein-alanine N-acetyltransferase